MEVIKDGIRMVVLRIREEGAGVENTWTHSLMSQTQPGLVRISPRGCHVGQIYYIRRLIKLYRFHFVLQQEILLLGEMSNLICLRGISNRTA